MPLESTSRSWTWAKAPFTSAKDVKLVTPEPPSQAELVKLMSGPVVVPPAFVATPRKWYNVLHVKPVIGALKPTGLVPDPTLTDEVELP